MIIPARFIFFYLIVSLFSYLFILPVPSFAATYFDASVPTGQDYQIVPASNCSGPSECANSQNPGNCGLPTCTSGKAWTKYELTCVYRLSLDDYDQYYIQGAVVYSIGDKCYVPEHGLHSSSCFGQPSPAEYKTCCGEGSPSLVNPGSCVAYSGDTTNPPYEGECPTGYRKEVFCGGSGEPACGQAACNTLNIPVLNTFEGINADGSGNICYADYPANTYKFSLSWSGPALDAAAAAAVGCKAGEYAVDIS